jgi:FixJ family two-component response regulator
MNKESDIIIVVDDDAVIGISVAEYLQTLNLRIFVFADPRQVLSFVSGTKHKIALLIADYNMLGINGEELAEEVKRLIPEIKTILMSGNVDIAESSMFKFDGFLEKPLFAHKLGEMVKTLLKK